MTLRMCLICGLPIRGLVTRVPTLGGEEKTYHPACWGKQEKEQKEMYAHFKNKWRMEQDAQAPKKGVRCSG